MANQTRGHHAPSEQAWAGSEIPAELARQIDPVDACDFSQVLDPAAGRITGNRVSDTRKPGRCLPWWRKLFTSLGQGQQVDHRLVMEVCGLGREQQSDRLNGYRLQRIGRPSRLLRTKQPVCQFRSEEHTSE